MATFCGIQCHKDRIKTSSKLAEFESGMSETSKRSADFKDVYMGLPPPNKPRDLADTYIRKKRKKEKLAT